MKLLHRAEKEVQIGFQESVEVFLFHLVTVSQMHRPQFLHGLAFQGFCHAMPMALVRMQFKAGQGHPLAFLDPALNLCQRLALLGQARALVIFKQRVIIRLGFQVPPLSRGNAELWKM